MYGYNLPEDFLIGTANSAFQSEGAWDRDGKSESIMDYYAKEYAGKYSPGNVPSKQELKSGRTVPLSMDLPDRGCFFYDNYEEYIEDMQKTGQNTYRLSLAWPRIIPTGTGEVNQKGIDFYNKVINKLLACNITPFVDLYHWDLPMCLMEKGGFANPDFPQWFEAYAKVCFENFGDRVKLWSTFNETYISVFNGYSKGTFPPFLMDMKNALAAGHNVMLAHFRAVRLYRSMNLGGKIGIVNCRSAIAPANIKQDDLKAVQIQSENSFDMWTLPLVEGKYPQFLIDEVPFVGENMPANYQADLDKWFTPMDFLGINYYVAARTQYDTSKPLHSAAAEPFFSAPGQMFTPYPAGLFDVVYYISQKYPSLDIYITENGCALENINDEEAECDDPARIEYLREHLRMVSRLIKCGVKLKGYYYWNDADSYEIQDGYRLRFGMTWVDHKTGRRRWKKSRYYFSEICKNKMVN